MIPPYTTSEDVDDAVAQAAAVYAMHRRAMSLVGGPSTWDSVANATSALPAYGIAEFVVIRLQQITGASAV